ncbi:MAG: tRNA (N(6)-L-threonylcarbamoyladenosine(37)-C(2))-methylthiotransferase MtaB [Candidatus Gastranaerophilales bacterium]|nr:tRNA (N(6)-L-threonylcarbamoyladenosine(37)-C(2))-methylthiotransferase MtaB [Candidatus Gastranaerophilales bacterium]
MKSFYLKSLGCKQNQLEGQIIENELLSLGYIKAKTLKEADIYILNSCSVTSHSDSQVNYLLKQAKRLKPEIKTVLTGCNAQTYKQHENFDYSDIDLVLGNSEKMNIEKYIQNIFQEKSFYVKDIFEVKEFENKFLKKPNTTRVSIKIQDGCNNRCSYCIIPYARGNSRSNSIENVLEQIRLVEKQNIKEIVLTGIHIGQWGLEFNKTLLDLLKEIEKTNIPRYRLGSLYINELDDEIIEFLSNSKKFCPHFHLSLQSLCDKTLNNMNRKYSAQEALDVIEKLHKKFNLPYLGCDIIVGFPQETEEDFQETYQNLKKAKLSSIHCFPYSKREKTPAFYMEQIKDEIKTKRTKKILELSEILHKEFLEKNKNTTQEILIEKKSAKTGLYSAVTKNYIKLYIKSEDENLRHSLRTIELNQFDLY